MISCNDLCYLGVIVQSSGSTATLPRNRDLVESWTGRNKSRPLSGPALSNRVRVAFPLTKSASESSYKILRDRDAANRTVQAKIRKQVKSLQLVTQHAATWPGSPCFCSSGGLFLDAFAQARELARRAVVISTVSTASALAAAWRVSGQRG